MPHCRSITSRIPSSLRSPLVVLIVLLLLSGCASRASGPYQPPTDQARNSIAAEKLTREAADLIATNPERAEEILREALTADVFHGPAHNNLGVIHLQRGELYEAAHEFEWARKLMPGHPDPRLNLALTLERAGRFGDASRTYAAALEVHPEHVPSMQALARLQIRTGRTDDRTADLLREIALRGETSAWRQWAQAQAIRMR